mgnify:CR=1 FL=1
MKIAFDNEKYLAAQKAAIFSRANSGAGRLYLEFGGKLSGDSHAARVLPGYDPDVKIRLLQQLSEKADIIICIHAEDIEQKKIRADLGITYDNAALKLIDDLRACNIEVTAVVITRFTGQQSAVDFHQRLSKHGLKVFFHQTIPDYPNDLDMIVSAKGFGANAYIPVTQQLVVVTGPGPSSGKMGTCLNQIYHEFENGSCARYAKFETFPVWNLPLDHPLNHAYEAATADLRDYNALDNFHYDAYKVVAVNYNRDLQAFPLLRALLTRITGSNDGYQSPTDMGVNCIISGIIDDKCVQAAAKQEIIRRFLQYEADFRLGRTATDGAAVRAAEIMQKANMTIADRKVLIAAREAAKDCELRRKGDGGIYCGAAMQLHNGDLITGKNSPLLHSSASMILNALKHLANIPDSQFILLPEIVSSVAKFKYGLGSNSRVGLDLSETLIVLVVSASRDIYAQKALACLPQLAYCDVHLSHYPSRGDEAGLRHLGCSYTYDPVMPTKNLFV